VKLRLFPRLRAARAENAALRYQLGRRDRLIAYQNARMRDMAHEALGMQAALRLARQSRQPSTVDTVVMERAG
jgi:hypothetical protein